jgi:predicted DCC family thiol-disulfide oxidoreductase YuxK
VALQRPEADRLLQDLTPAERLASWHLISPGGERSSGGAAVAELLRMLPGGHAPAACFARFPELTDHAYEWVVDHRSQLSRLVPSKAKLRAGAWLSRRARDTDEAY